MRGPGWIKEMRRADAQQLRDQIVVLEGELIKTANNPKGKWKLHEIAHVLRAHKARLKLLEQCIDGMPHGR